MNGYQLDFLIPGISPLFASSLKQILHSSNLRINARFLPQRQQRRTTLVEYFGAVSERSDLIFCAVVAIYYFLKGKPKPLSSKNAASLVLAVVEIVTSRP